jgi:UPF0755 protein
MSNLPPVTRRELNKKAKKFRKPLIAIITIVVLLAGTAYVNKSTIRSWIDVVSGSEYSGSGAGVVTFIVNRGDNGEDVARALVDLGITKEYNSTLRTIYAANPTFFPGSYLVPKHISTTDAIKILTNPTNMIVNKVTIREGLRISSVLTQLSQATGISIDELVAESKKLASFGLPKATPSLEGYLFPATYSFAPGLSAHEVLAAMVTRTKEQLVQDGVSKKDWHRVLTLASVIQMEARQTPDFYKVSRVFTNRLAIGMHLQSDATVSYGVNGSTVSTSNADRNNTNKYNTYLYPGLPVGPISGAGATAIDAALHPADGSWLFFCAINLKTGETVFSTTIAEHEKAVAQWRAWMIANPGWNG